MEPSSAFSDVHASIRRSRILLVDDAETSLFFLEQVLTNGGFVNIEKARNGQQALQAFSTFRPDLIILDLLMPGMDGFDCCRAIRALPEGDTLPVLVQTALTVPEEKIRAFREGATDFITKPLFPDELYARVIVHLEKQFAMKKLQAYKQRVETELDSARELQHAILPRESDMDNIRKNCGLDIAAHVAPSSEIGGDFWGVRALSTHLTAFWIVDFSGHGVAAALNVFRLHTCLQEHSVSATKPGKYLSELNDKLVSLLPKGQFATMFYGVIDIPGNRLHFAAAGSTNPIVIHKGKTMTQTLDGSGRPLGIAPGPYPTRSIDFLAGDSICFYSDALTETANAQGNCAGDDELKQWLKAVDGPAQAKIIHVVHQFERYTNARSWQDDLTIGLIQRLSES